MFLLFYGFNVATNAFQTFYDIAVDIEEREEQKENPMPDSVKHMYS